MGPVYARPPPQHLPPIVVKPQITLTGCAESLGMGRPWVWSRSRGRLVYLFGRELGASFVKTNENGQNLARSEWHCLAEKMAAHSLTRFPFVGK